MYENILSYMKEPEGTYPCDDDLARADLVPISVILVDPAHEDTKSKCLLS